MEWVQRRFTRMLPGLEVLSYMEGVDKLGLFSLEPRGLRSNLTEAYEIMGYK